MTDIRRWMVSLLVAAVLLAACGPGQPEAGLDEEAIQDLAWQALGPNTSSGDRAHWQVDEVRRVEGREVAEEFAGEAWYGCWKGPTPTPNGTIQAGSEYWYVALSPRPATPVPQEREVSPTEPPFIPEPFLREAYFLLDTEGQIVARKLYCVIY
jgi:hypothetical protein